MAWLIRSHPLGAFFVLAFGITWVVWVPRAAGVPMGAVGQLWTWAPAVAALLAAALTGGRAAVGELGARLVRWRVSWRWYLVVILGPAAFSLAVTALYVLLGGSWAAAPPALRGEASLASLPLFLVILTITDGLGEEPSWRGSHSRGCSASTTRCWQALFWGCSGRRGTSRWSGWREPRSTNSPCGCSLWT
jgi:hypothetical protein